MSLVNVFENVTDAIIVINENSEITYINPAASLLIKSTKLAHLGLTRLSDMLVLALQGKVQLPMSLNVTVDTTKQAFIATLTKVNTLLIVSLSSDSTSSVGDSHAVNQNNQTIMYALAKPLKNIETWLETHPAFNDQAAIQLLQQQLSEIKLITSLSIPPLQQHRQLILSDLLIKAGNKLQNSSLHSGFSLRIYDHANSCLAVNCPLQWLIHVFADSLLYIHKQDIDRTVIVTIEHGAYFTTLHLTSDVSPELNKESDVPSSDELFIQGSKTKMAQQTIDLSLTSYIVSKLRGNIRINREQIPFNLSIQLPNDEAHTQDKDILLQQGKQFALELAQLKSQMDQMQLT